MKELHVLFRETKNIAKQMQGAQLRHRLAAKNPQECRICIQKLSLGAYAADSINGMLHQAVVSFLGIAQRLFRKLSLRDIHHHHARRFFRRRRRL